jgi:hypothetical protein
MSLQHRFLPACGSSIEFLDSEVTVSSRLYAADHSQKTVDQKTCFSLVSHRPIGYRDRRTSDSDFPHSTVPKTPLIEKLDFHWFLVDRWDFEQRGPQIRTSHGRLPTHP